MVASSAPKGVSAAKSEVWSKKNACVVCCEVCKTEEEKKVHEGKQTHIKKMSIYTFLSKEAAKIASSDLPSVLLRRFSITKERAVGLECMHEISFPWSAGGWWLCSICYDSGCTFEQAEQHVRSVRHLSTYLEEFNPEKASKVDEYRRDVVEHYEQLINARNEIYEEQGEMLLPPEILELAMTKEVAMAKLVVGSIPTPGRVVYPIQKDEDTTKRAIVKCTTCFEVIPCVKKNVNKVWNVHENTPSHRRCSAITGILSQLPCEEVIEADAVIDEGPYNWRQQNGAYHGPVCGITYLLTCGSENYCTLCFCKAKSIEEHFSSEHHILRFLTFKKTQDMFAVFQHNGLQRRSRMAELLMETPLDTESHRKLPANFLPSLLLEFSNEEVLEAGEFMPPVGNFGFDGKCLICEDCCLVIKVPQDKKVCSVGIWNDHVNTSAHFDFMARRSSFRFYDEFFVPLVSTVSLPKPDLRGEWKDIEFDNNTSYRIQTQCDVGLEWIVEDQENGEVVCTLCARTYKKDSKDAIKNHVRSYLHLNQYLHMTNRELLAIVMMQNSEKSVLDLIMQWLQTNSKVSQAIIYDPAFMQPTVLRENWSQIRVYSPDKATRIAKKQRVPTRLVSLAYCEPTLRPLLASLAPVIDAVAQDGVEKETVDLREALCVSSVRIVHMDDQDNLQTRRWLLRCMTCQMVFSTTVEHLVRDIWEEHMHSAEHDRRIHNYETCNLDMCGFAEASSTYTVKPFLQADPSKKVTWQWNAKHKVHDFVLCVIGLEDLVERKSNLTEGVHNNADFFCRLCAEVIPRRAALLEEHVRSGKHVMSYVQKYHPMTIFQIDSLKSDEGGKLLRRMVAQLLKDVKPPSEYCIPVYDPIGEQERKGQLAIAQAKEADRQKSLEESRKKAQEARMARDEERRKLLAIELEKEKKRRAERDRREMEAKVRAATILAEKERIKVMAEERLRLRRMDEEKLAREKEEKEKKEAASRRSKIKAVLEQEKAMLKTREKRIILDKEKRELEKRRTELLEKAANMKKKTTVPVPEPKLLIAPQLSSQPAPQMSMMSMPPPPMLTKAMTMDFSMPPPTYGSFEMGPAPTFSTYVPTAEAMPVYPMDGEEIDGDSMSYRSSSRSRSTSRSRRRSRSRKRSRSRSRSRSRRKSRRSRSRSRTRKSGDKSRSKSPKEKKKRSYSPVPISPPTDDIRKTLTPVKTKKVDGERQSLQGKEVDPYVTNEALIGTRAQLVDYLWRQGAEKIPSDELPDAFSKKAAEVEGNIGIDNIYEVVCLDSSELDTFYCSICGVWNTPSEILKHIATSEHKLAYLFRAYKHYHSSIMSESNSVVRRQLLDNYALQIWNKEQPPPKICNRLRAVLNRATIIRVWPEHIHMLDHSWKMDGLGLLPPVSRDVYSGAFSVPPPNFNVPPPKPVPAPPGFATLPPTMTPIGYPLPVTTQTVAPTVTTTTSKGTSSSGSTAKKSSNGSSSNDKDKRKRSPSPRSSRKRSSSRDRHRHSSPRRRSKSPRRRSRSPPKKKRSRSRDRDRTRRRSRSRDRSRDRSRRSSSRSRTSRSSKDSGDKKILSKGDLSWMDSAAAFLEKLGDVSAAKSIREHKQSSGVPPVVTQPAVAPPVVVSAAPTTRQIPSLALVTPQTVLPPARVQPQQMIYRAPPPLTTLPPVRIGFPPPQQQQQAKPLVPQQQPVCITLDDDRPQQQPPVRDEKAEMRKLLGVLITMQQEAERSGGLDPATVDRLYQEVGLKKTEGLNSDQLLAQLLTQLAGSVPTEKKTVDLSAFGISAASTSAPMSQPPPSFYPQQQQYNPPSLAPVPQNDQYQKLLAQLNETKRPTPAPIVPQNPYSSMPRTEDFFRDSNVSYVYPDGGAPTEEPQPVQAKAPEPDPKKEKAALRKKKLLEQAELLRKQAEASDGDDDDWDNLESEMTQMLDSAPVATSSATATPTERSSPSLNQARMGVPLKWAQPVPQPVKPPALTPFIPTPQQQEVVPIAPGQKMPLARTMLPNGKLPPGVQQQAPSQETPAAPAAATVEPPVSQAAPSLQPVQQPQPGYSGYGQPTAYMQQPMYGGYQQQQQYGQMYAQPQQYPYMQQGYGMAQQYMQPAAPGTGQAYPQQTAQQQQQQQYYAQYGQQPQQQYKY